MLVFGGVRLTDVFFVKGIFSAIPGNLGPWVKYRSFAPRLKYHPQAKIIQA